MKNIIILIVVVLATITGIVGCGESKDDKNFLALKMPANSNLKILTDPVLNVDTATNFVQRLKDSLIAYKGKVKWPIDSASGEYVRSWSVDMKYIIYIQEELKKLKDVSEVGIKFYPVINDKKAFSIMIVGEYVKNGKKYILKYKVDPATGEQGIKDIAPMYEWLDPCPPFDCPENEF